MLCVYFIDGNLVEYIKFDIDGLPQKRHNSFANALQLCLFLH